jgi:hypothetical protein
MNFPIKNAIYVIGAALAAFFGALILWPFVTAKLTKPKPEYGTGLIPEDISEGGDSDVAGPLPGDLPVITPNPTINPGQEEPPTDTEEPDPAIYAPAYPDVPVTEETIVVPAPVGTPETEFTVPEPRGDSTPWNGWKKPEGARQIGTFRDFQVWRYNNDYYYQMVTPQYLIDEGFPFGVQGGTAQTRSDDEVMISAKKKIFTSLLNYYTPKSDISNIPT